MLLSHFIQLLDLLLVKFLNLTFEYKILLHELFEDFQLISDVVELGLKNLLGLCGSLIDGLSPQVEHFNWTIVLSLGTTIQ